ncbi:hypothetical protein ncot_11345 [Nocardioides sp. JQ2195]|uniref:FUSC family protein n=1 Tax=Nocardioides sp. JQ2195 TaxID=2592334 RepID=UPI00143EAE1D|nr:hypothetical protein [Nocardioides sp. JQ2195]QIX27124.1 hypothetical protein ncot_11345 [Nocardioides sp. JQ2195]
MATSVRELWGCYPLIPVAIKAALAAALAWLVVQPLGGPADDYSYYAPLGAVVVVSSRLTESLRSSMETVLAIAMGATLAVAARWAPLPEVVGIGLVVGIGTLLGAWKRVGSMASWVPISALFILIVGGPQPAPYVLSYLGLTALGAVVGVVVNMLAPPMPMIATRNVQKALRDLLADQLDGLADGLERDPLPTKDEWRIGESEIADKTQRAQELMEQVSSASRMNWRVRWSRSAADQQDRQNRALNHLSFLVQEMTTLLAHQENADRSLVALGPTLRPPAVHTFRTAADALRSVDSTVAGDEELAAAHRAADEFADAIRQQQDGSNGETFAAGGLVTAIRRVLASVTAEEESQPVSES